MTDNPVLEALLEVQAHDTRLDQLHHHLSVLPERAARDAASAALAATTSQIEAEQAIRDDLARTQKRIDDEVESFKAKRDGFNTKLYSGTVTNPRELQDIQEEIDSLGRRVSHLEDEELEIMEQVEPVEASLTELAATLAANEASLERCEQELTVAEAEARGEVETETAARLESAAPVPADVLATYDKLRAGLGGVAIARLKGTQCGGCHLTLSAMEAARMRKLPTDEIGHCDECGRILVP